MVRFFAMMLIFAICVMALLTHIYAHLFTTEPQRSTIELKTDKEEP